MSQETPKLSTLRKQVRGDVQALLPGADTLLSQSNLRVMSDVQAALVYGLYGALEWQRRQLFADTAEGEFLERRAEMMGLARKAATTSSGSITISGLSGATLAEGAELQAGNGVVVATDALVAVGGGGTASVAVTAREAGAAANLDEGVTFSLVTAVAGIDAEATVDAPGLAGGADEESDDDLRGRVLLRMRETPQGGAALDYSQWALEVAGVTRAWVSPKEMGLGTTTVRFMMDNVRAAENGIPQGDDASDYIAGSGDQQDVYDHIDALRPCQGVLFVVAPVPVALDLTITGLSPDSAAVRAAIEASVRDMLVRDAVPGGTIRHSRIVEAISVAAGESYHKLTAPVDDVAHSTGEIAVPGDITYV